jgi:KUP system potassium uptake protein
MISVLALILIFRKSDKLAPIYAINVTADMFLSSFFFVFVMYYTWGKHPLLIFLYIAVFWTIDLFLLSSALTKVPDGGWVTIIFTVVLFAVMYVWYTTNHQVEKALQRKLLDAEDLCNFAKNMTRSKGTGVFVSYSEEDVPNPLGWFITRANVLPEVVVCLTIHASHHPVIPDELKVICKPIDVRLGLYRMILQYGFGETMVPFSSCPRLINVN